MRALNRNERLLAIAFGAVLVLVLNLAGMRWVADQMRTLRGEINSLKADQIAAGQMLTQRPYYASRESWLKAHPPAVYDERTSQSEFVESMNRSAQSHGLKIVSQVPSDEHSGDLAVTKIDLQIAGRLESIVRWLHDLQQPGKFMFVDNFALSVADDGNTMQLQVLLGRVYRVGGSTTSP